MDLIYPKLVRDDVIDFFKQYDGERLPEDAEELEELSGRLRELNIIISEILSENMMIFSALLQNLNTKAKEIGKSRYDLTAEELSINDVLITICYPFFDRFGGSFEARFALSGDLIRYLRMYKEKIGQ